MEFMPDFTLHRPTKVEEAVKLHNGNSGAKYVAGGTDMIVNVRRGIEQPSALIDLSAIKDLQKIKENEEEISIGAGVTLSTLANEPGIQKTFSAISEAAASVAGPTHQNYGTIGGNLCLDTRCLFYNQSEWWRQSNDYCLKERGSLCHVAPGGNICFAAFSGDVAPAALIHKAEIEIAGTNSRKRVPLEALYLDDGMNHLTITPGELLCAVHLPKSETGISSTYKKARIRGSIDFPLAGVAVGLKHKNKLIEEIFIAITAVNPYPHKIKGLEKFFGRIMGSGELDEIAEIVRRQAKPMRTTTVKPWYRRRVVGAMARRLVEQLIKS